MPHVDLRNDYRAQPGIPTSNQRYEFEEDPHRPRARMPWKKVVLPILGAVLLITGIFTGGYFRGIEVGKRARSENSPTAEKLINAQWQSRPCVPKEGCPSDYSKPPLIIISFDGFWKGYLERGLTPALEHLASCGVKADYMRPIFPSKTFPNHYTIVTGLYPESHGIVDNRMSDPQLGRMFRIGKSDSLNPVWWEKEPIWVTAEKAGKRTATFFWPGSDVKIHGVRPSYYFFYNVHFPWTCRVETVLAWLDLPPESRPDFITLYYHEPDSTGHEYGPNSSQVNKALEQVDAFLNYFMSKLAERNLLGCVNMIIVGDHGMAETSCDRTIVLEQYMNISKVFTITGSTGRIGPKIGPTQAIVDRVINKLKCKHDHLFVYHKKNLPKRYHYSNHRRIDPIVLDMDSGWLVYNTEADAKNYCPNGAHGYDNMAPSMQTVFVAYGPAFKEHLTIKPFLNIELYELMTEVLNITAQPNNGTRGSLHHILKNPVPLPDPPSLFYPDMCIPPVVEDPEHAKDFPDCDCDRENVIEDPMITSHPSKYLLDLHTPWKAPAYQRNDTNDAICMLINDEYISAYHTEWKIPVWSAFTLKQPEERGNVDSCWRSERRIAAENSSRCSDFETMAFRKEGLTFGTLFPADFVSSDESEVWLLSNAVPMYNTYLSEVATEMNHLLFKWAKKHGTLNVVTGPAFDIHGTGLEPTAEDMIGFKGKEKLPVPTHFFIIVTRCLTPGSDVETCKPDYLDTLGFLLPHLPQQAESCDEDPQVYLLQHAAKVKDIEILTGLQFFTGLPVYQTIRLRTQLPEGLWPSV